MRTGRKMRLSPFGARSAVASAKRSRDRVWILRKIPASKVDLGGLNDNDYSGVE